MNSISEIEREIIECVRARSPYLALSKTGVIPAMGELPDPMSALPKSSKSEYYYQLRRAKLNGPEIEDQGVAIDALKKAVTAFVSADARGTYLDRSGLKAVCNYRSAEIAGGIQCIDTEFPNRTPSVLYRKALWVVANIMRDCLSEGIDDELFLIGSEEVSRFAEGYEEKEIEGYRFLTGEGFLFGLDSQPLRFNEFEDGCPKLIEPDLDISSRSTVNPAWMEAENEVFFLAGIDGFKRLKEDSGDVKLSKDEAGVFNVLYSRAWKPERPHSICPVIYRRG